MSLVINTSGGNVVDFLMTDRILNKFFEQFILQKKSEYTDGNRNVIKVPGGQYDETGASPLY